MLSHLKVIDLAAGLGDYTGRLLAALGAEWLLPDATLGWDVLGWQNQDNNSDIDPNNPYAIGGRISGRLSKSVSNQIQSTLINYHDKYPE